MEMQKTFYSSLPQSWTRYRRWQNRISKMLVMPATLQDYRKVTRATMAFDIDQFNGCNKKLLSLCNALHEIKLTVTSSVLPFCFFCTTQISNNLWHWKVHGWRTLKLYLKEKQWEMLGKLCFLHIHHVSLMDT